MKLYNAFAAALAALFAASCNAPQTDNAVFTSATLISNVTVVDAVNGVRPNTDIVLQGDKIISVKPAQRRKTSSDFKTIIDGTGKFLIPGLWDSHVHVTGDENVDHKTFFPLSIAYGVTSLRDTGGHIDKLAAARALSAADETAPTLYVSGPLVDGRQRVYDGLHVPGSQDMSIGVETPEQAAAAIDELAAAGVDFIKAYEMLSPEAFAAVTKRAQQHGLPVAAHIPLSVTAKDAVFAGVNDMQHLRNIEMACAADADNLHEERIALLETGAEAHGYALRASIHKAQRVRAVRNQAPDACNALLALLAEKKVFQTPTLAVMRVVAHRYFLDLEFRKTYDYLPPAARADWLKRMAPYTNYPFDDDARAFDDWLTGMIPRLSAAGVPILAGTDAPLFFLTPGASLHEEMFLLQDAGLSPMEVLKAATSAPAAFFGLENEIGAIEEGMRADLVLLSADPLLDISNAKAIDAVFKNGNYLDRARLDDLLEQPSKEGQ